MCTVFVNVYYNEYQPDQGWMSCVATHAVKFFPDFPASRLGTGKSLSFFLQCFQAPASTFPSNVYNDEIHISNYSPPNLSS